MKTKTGLLILFLLIIGITAIAFVAMRIKPTPENRRAERIINAYLLDEGLSARPGSQAYSQLMKGILFGEYPELTHANIGYLENPGDADLILNYAAGYIARQAGRPEYGEIPEAPTP